MTSVQLSSAALSEMSCANSSTVKKTMGTGAVVSADWQSRVISNGTFILSKRSGHEAQKHPCLHHAIRHKAKKHLQAREAARSNEECST